MATNIGYGILKGRGERGNTPFVFNVIHGLNALLPDLPAFVLQSGDQK